MADVHRESDRSEVDEWLRAATERLVDELEPDRILLFGSYARGTATRRSDIDLCVVWENELSPLDRIGKVLQLLKDSPRPIEAVVYTPSEIDRMDTPFVRRILAEGKVLYERGKTAA